MNSPGQERYQRQMQLIGDDGQARLARAKVLIVGMGGLGNAVLPVLAGAGVGEIGIMDGDRVSLSNLHRQPLFAAKDVGRMKVEVAAANMNTLNPEVAIHAIPEHLSGFNALDLFPAYDIIVDATDRVPTRYLINAAALLSDRPFVHAAIHRFQAQGSVFNYQNGPTYRCLYPEVPPVVQACDDIGVLGSTVALAGGLQASEVLKMILGLGEIASGKLLLRDTLRPQLQTVSFAKTDAYSTSPEDFYNFDQQVDAPVVSLELAIERGFRLLDVREAGESPALPHAKVLNIPLSELDHRWQEADTGVPVAVFCQSGARARKAWTQLTEKGLADCFCLKEQAGEIANELTDEKENRIH